MELVGFITDLIDFLGISGLVFLFSAIYLIRKKWAGTFDFSRPDGRITYNRTNGNYEPNGNNFARNSMFQSDDDDSYSYNTHTNTNNDRNYDGVDGTGDYIMNGSYDDSLDFSNPSHYPIIDSYDNNIDENNSTKPW